MHVLMLGWEFPPYITGGLGTACHGLTKALSRRDVRVTFVVPRPVDNAQAEHVTLMSPAAPPTAPAGSTDALRTLGIEPPGDAEPAPSVPSTPSAPAVTPVPAELAGEDDSTRRALELEGVQFLEIPAEFRNPYAREAGEDAVGAPARSALRDDVQADHRRPGSAGAGAGAPPAAEHSPRHDEQPRAAHGAPVSPQPSPAPATSTAGAPPPPPPPADYGGDLFTQVERYARFCTNACERLDFDVIHVHDWMTYPAGLRLARATGRPLVAHIHSTEYDRAGEGASAVICEIERRGMHSAAKVIAVSQLTKNVVMRRYGLRDAQVEVVYNGVDLEPSRVGITGIRKEDRIVLYFGRITYQKGPEFFIAAAKRVLEVMPDVKFVVAGSGDMAKRMIEMAAEMGIGHKVLFTGFLRGDAIKRVFALADLYVMPSISEPFGIAPLEAMGHDVPVLISRTSGVSEVLTHALKVDFWDVDEMANKIIAVLRHPPLSQTLREHGAFEVRQLTWDGAAHRCEQVYRKVTAS